MKKLAGFSLGLVGRPTKWAVWPLTYWKGLQRIWTRIYLLKPTNIWNKIGETRTLSSHQGKKCVFRPIRTELTLQGEVRNKISTVPVIVPGGILTRKLKDMVGNRCGHSAGKAKSLPKENRGEGKDTVWGEFESIIVHLQSEHTDMKHILI